MICSVEGCDRRVKARGWCHKHYMRWYERGTIGTLALEHDPVERFWARVHKTASCWHWTGSRSSKGYGLLHLTRDGRKTSIRAHRFAYELLVGPVPEGLQLDHICSVRHCVNPAHLEPVTNAENTRRSYQRRRSGLAPMLGQLPIGEGC